MAATKVDQKEQKERRELENNVIGQRFELWDEPFEDALSEFHSFYKYMCEPLPHIDGNENEKNGQIATECAEIDAKCEQLLSKLEWCELRTSALQPFEQVLSNDIEISKQESKKFQEKSENITNEINNQLTQRLENEELRKEHRLIYYNKFNNIANARNEKRQTLSKMASLNKDFEILKKDMAKVDSQVKFREKQCLRAWNAVSALKNDIYVSSKSNENDNKSKKHSSHVSRNATADSNKSNKSNNNNNGRTRSGSRSRSNYRASSGKKEFDSEIEDSDIDIQTTNKKQNENNNNNTNENDNDNNDHDVVMKM